MMNNLPSTSHQTPQRMVRPLGFLPEARKRMMRTKDLEIAAKGDMEELRKLLVRHPERLNQRSSHHRTLLWEAVRRGKMPAVKWLVEQGADVNAVGRYNGESFILLTPYCAAIYYHRLELTEYLRAHGAREDIFRAAYLGDIEAVTRELAAHPEQTHAEDPQDPLYYVPLLSFAVAGGRMDLVEFLLEHGAVIEPYSAQLLSLAAKGGRKDILDLLLKHHAQVVDLGAYYFSNTFKLEILRYFLDHGASASRKGENGFPPLVYFCRADKGEHPEKIKLLLDFQAPVDGLGPKGRTALHYAAAAGFLEVMTLLLDHGANTRMRDQQGETPLALARRYERMAAGNLLEERGAIE
jgi:ankyrin repeat protein